MTGFVLAAMACGDEPAGPEEASSDTLLAPPEFTIQYVKRLPEIDAVPDPPDPTRDGWPEPGQSVTWRAHVKLRDVPEELESFEVEWMLDGVEVERERVPVGDEEVVTVDLPWTWTFDRHRLRFVVDPEDEIEEASELNNEVEVVTDALAVAFLVEQSHYDFYNDHIHEVRSSSNSFEDYAHAVIRASNHLFSQARHPGAPDGVLDRYRLDKIVLYPDDEAPSSGRFGDRRDHTVDLQFVFDAGSSALSIGEGGSYHPLFGDAAGTIQHELGHSRGLKDVYRWDLFHDGNSTFIDIDEDGESIVGERFFPAYTPVVGGGAFLHETEEEGLMNREYGFVDRYSTLALNRIAGHRMDPACIGIPCMPFYYEFPEENVVTLVDREGTALADADVEVYRSDFGSGDFQAYYYYFDDVPDLSTRSDATGRIALPQDLFCGASGERGCPFQRHALFRVVSGERIGYGILESRLYNLAYWTGDTERAEYEVEVPMTAR